MEQIKPDTLLVYLTVEQFTSLLQKLLPTQEPVKESLPEYFGIDTFCEITGYKKNTVYQLVRQKKIPVYRAAHGRKKLMFKRDETEKWMVNKRMGDLNEFIEKKNNIMHNKFT
ncbi:helix-turn-helix domain-containing protein [uncultured Odoribacter sp.]|uniref:helix-turn-helix domain-containing protein n=1 Tax=uncultured Odoribacter sp. TaxID=876416 RepID=UPI002617A4E1|nr:helix-turn-helix domain-containing protein [uncultured Odoribacter sp.]